MNDLNEKQKAVIFFNPFWDNKKVPNKEEFLFLLKRLEEDTKNFLSEFGFSFFECEYKQWEDFLFISFPAEIKDLDWIGRATIFIYSGISEKIMMLGGKKNAKNFWLVKEVHRIDEKTVKLKIILDWVYYYYAEFCLNKKIKGDFLFDVKPLKLSDIKEKYLDSCFLCGGGDKEFEINTKFGNSRQMTYEGEFEYAGVWEQKDVRYKNYPLTENVSPSRNLISVSPGSSSFSRSDWKIKNNKYSYDLLRLCVTNNLGDDVNNALKNCFLVFLRPTHKTLTYKDRFTFFRNEDRKDYYTLHYLKRHCYYRISLFGDVICDIKGVEKITDVEIRIISFIEWEVEVILNRRSVLKKKFLIKDTAGKEGYDKLEKSAISNTIKQYLYGAAGILTGNVGLMGSSFSYALKGLKDCYEAIYYDAGPYSSDIQNFIFTKICKDFVNIEIWTNKEKYLDYCHNINWAIFTDYFNFFNDKEAMMISKETDSQLSKITNGWIKLSPKSCINTNNLWIEHLKNNEIFIYSLSSLETKKEYLFNIYNPTLNIGEYFKRQKTYSPGNIDNLFEPKFLKKSDNFKERERKKEEWKEKHKICSDKFSKTFKEMETQTDLKASNISELEEDRELKEQLEKEIEKLKDEGLSGEEKWKLERETLKSYISRDKFKTDSIEFTETLFDKEIKELENNKKLYKQDIENYPKLEKVFNLYIEIIEKEIKEMQQTKKILKELKYKRQYDNLKQEFEQLKDEIIETKIKVLKTSTEEAKDFVSSFSGLDLNFEYLFNKDYKIKDLEVYKGNFPELAKKAVELLKKVEQLKENK